MLLRMTQLIHLHNRGGTFWLYAPMNFCIPVTQHRLDVYRLTSGTFINVAHYQLLAWDMGELDWCRSWKITFTADVWKHRIWTGGGEVLFRKLNICEYLSSTFGPFARQYVGWWPSWATWVGPAVGGLQGCAVVYGGRA
jgi:hypothetical protein